MERFISVVLVLVAVLSISAIDQDSSRIYKFENGNWFDGKRFEPGTFYSVHGVLSKNKPNTVDKVVDLKGGYVIPPFGDAHTHNLDGLFNLERLVQGYLDEGTFYVQVLGNNSAGALESRLRLNRFDTLDVIYANGMITRTFGHPFMVYEPLAMGIYNPADAYRRMDDVKKSRRGLGGSYWFFDSKKDVDANWQKVLAAKPDLIKISLLDANAKNEDPAKKGVDGGLSPEVAAHVVKRAHEAKLRVYAHVETPEDFRLGVRLGVDGFAHLPGYGWDGRKDIADDLTLKDFQLAARKKIVVIPTAARGRYSYTDYAQDGKETVDETRKKRVISRQKKLLREMQKAGVKIALGFDSFGSTVLPEILYFAENQVFDNATLLRIATETTPQTIFPNRRIGRLSEGYEANFLVIDANPLKDISAVKRISTRVKKGELLSSK